MLDQMGNIATWMVDETNEKIQWLDFEKRGLEARDKIKQEIKRLELEIVLEGGLVINY